MNIKRLNINIGGQPSIGFGGDKKKFNDLSLLIGSELPESYMEFICKADGGHPEMGYFRLQKNCAIDNSIDIDWFYSLANRNVEIVNDVYKNWVAVLGNKFLPLGRDGGGNQVYIELDSASVWLYLHKNEIKLKLSNSLEEFIDGLEENPDII